eukprot:scaffold7725_cov99-Cyclotella_meneghiniana.AAC.1
MPSVHSNLQPRGSFGAAAAQSGLQVLTSSSAVTTEKAENGSGSNASAKKAARPKVTPGFLLTAKAGGKGTKRLKDLAGKPLGKLTTAAIPKSPVKKNLMLPNPTSPTATSQPNKRVQVESPAREALGARVNAVLNPDANSFSPSSPMTGTSLSYATAAKKQFSPNSFSSEDTMDKVISAGGRTKAEVKPEADDSSDDTESVITKEKFLELRNKARLSRSGLLDDSDGTRTTATPPKHQDAGRDETIVEDASDEDVARPDPSRSDVRKETAPVHDDKMSLSDPELSDWEDVDDDATAPIGDEVIKPPQSAKNSGQKLPTSQPTITTMFSKQQQQSRATKLESANTRRATVKPGDYEFRMDDAMTSILSSSLEEVANLLCQKHRETLNFASHPSESPFELNYHVNDNEMWVVNKSAVGIMKLPEALWAEQFEGESEFNKIDGAEPESPQPDD